MEQDSGSRTDEGALTKRADRAELVRRIVAAARALDTLPLCAACAADTANGAAHRKNCAVGLALDALNGVVE